MNNLREFPDFSQARVLVIGDVMLDRYYHGGTKRISPEAPVPVVHIQHEVLKAGGAGNVALNLKSLGAEVALLGVVGCDEAAEHLETSLKMMNIDVHFIRTHEHPTITKLRIVSQNQQLLRLDFEEKLKQFDYDALLTQFDRMLDHYNVVILSDYNKGTLKNPAELIACAKQKNVKIIVDPKLTDYRPYQYASLITPNRDEFIAVAGAWETKEELISKARSLIDQIHAQAILVTLSEKGMLYVTNECVLHQSAQAKEVYDVTGAGDTVIALMGACISCGVNPEMAIELATLAAGIVVGRQGAASVSSPELRRAFYRAYGVGVGILTQEQAYLAIQDAKAHGERVVMTNGCFDILHAGHIAYLQEARAQGDRLLIAVNDDDSVRRLKGSTRPINTLAHRMEVLSALGVVDFVVPFSEDTPANLIERLLPDVLVKGGDYTVEQIAGHDAVLSNGGEVKILNFVEGLSTTNLLKRAVAESVYT